MILDLLTSGGLGALTGLFGSIITAITNFKMQKMKNDHDIAKIKAESEAIKIEAEAEIKVTQAETEGQVAIAEVDALKTTYEQAAKPLFEKSYMKILMGNKWFAWLGAIIAFLFGFVDFLSKSCRPVLTYYLMACSTWLTLITYDILKKSMGSENILPVDKAYELFHLVIMTIIFLTVSCVSWWFCDRQTSKFLMRLQDGNVKETGNVPF